MLILIHTGLLISSFLLITLTTAREYVLSGSGKHVFTIENGTFFLDGKKFNVYAGEIHYFRIAACEWEDRLKKLQKAGLNTVSTAVEWATHEPTPGNYDWSGNANFTQFVKIAHTLNLFVIIRSGPYIGADRSLGGFPEWLLHIDRKRDPSEQHLSSKYMDCLSRWITELLRILSIMMISSGGPVIMVQIGSESGNDNCEYKRWLYEIYNSYLGEDTVFFSMDQKENQGYSCMETWDSLAALRIDPWKYIHTHKESTIRLFSTMRKVIKPLPKLVELRTGVAWNWKGQRLTYDNDHFKRTLSDLIDADASVIIYMFAGGTNFERAGKDIGGLALTTSYDFDAVISESGHLTEKFEILRSILPDYHDFPIIYEPSYDEIETAQGESYDLYGNLKFISLGSFLDSGNLKKMGYKSIVDRYPRSFTEIGISDGLLLYETHDEYSNNHENGTELSILHCTGVNDVGYVYIDQEFIGILDSIRNSYLRVHLKHRNRIKILVENQGYRTTSMIGESKGITSNVTLDNKVIQGWKIHLIPLNNVTQLQNNIGKLEPRTPYRKGNALLMTRFKLPDTISNNYIRTYINLRNLGRGQVFLNEYKIGRYSENGPQYELYIPGCFFKPYPLENQMLILEMRQRNIFIETRTVFKSRSKNLSKESPSTLLMITLIHLFYQI